MMAKHKQVFSLIAQRDNKLNKTTADYSVDIAKLSAQDGRAMKLLAEAASRDSAAMRSISMVTICFLPGTFMAVSTTPDCS
jgi:hypothetical protein